jgi:hypothetical protein
MLPVLTTCSRDGECAQDGNDNELKVNTYAAFTSAGMAVHVLEDYPVDEVRTSMRKDTEYDWCHSLSSLMITTCDSMSRPH